MNKGHWERAKNVTNNAQKQDTRQPNRGDGSSNVSYGLFLAIVSLYPRTRQQKSRMAI